MHSPLAALKGCRNN